MIDRAFCPACDSYLNPTEICCPQCGWQRTRLEQPLPPNRPYWESPADVSMAKGATFSPTPCACEGKVIFSWKDEFDQGGLVAVDQNTGKVEWTLSDDNSQTKIGMVQAGSIAFEGRVYFATRHVLPKSDLPNDVLGAYYEVDGRTGTIVNRVNLQGGVNSLPVILKPYVWVVASDGAVYGLRPGSPKIKRAAHGLPKGWQRFAAHGDCLVVVQTPSDKKHNNPVTIVPVASPRSFPYRVLDGLPVNAVPVSDGKRVYLATRSANKAQIIALVPQELRVEWSVDLPDCQIRRLAYSEGCLAAASDENVFLVRLGAEKPVAGKYTTIDPRQNITTPLVLYNGLVIFGTERGEIYEYATTGQPKLFAKVHLGELGLAPSAVVAMGVEDGVLYAGTRAGQAIALPWHLWQYSTAAHRLENMGRPSEAAMAWVHAAALENGSPAQKQTAWDHALRLLEQQGPFEWAAGLHLAGGSVAQAAAFYQKAAELYSRSDSRRAAIFYRRASDCYADVGNAESASACLEQAHRRLPAPHLRVRLLQPPQGVKAGKPYPVIIELMNRGQETAHEVQARFSGNVACDGWETIQDELKPGNLTSETVRQVTPTGTGSLKVEVRYHGPGQSDWWTASAEGEWRIQPLPNLHFKDDAALVIINTDNPNLTAEFDGMVGKLVVTRPHQLRPGDLYASFKLVNRVVCWEADLRVMNKVTSKSLDSQLNKVPSGYMILRWDADQRAYLPKATPARPKGRWNPLERTRVPEKILCYYGGRLELPFQFGPFSGLDGKKKMLLLSLSLEVDERSPGRLVYLFPDQKSTVESIEITNTLSRMVQIAVEIWRVGENISPFGEIHRQRDSLMTVLESELKGVLLDVGLKLIHPLYIQWAEEAQ